MTEQISQPDANRPEDVAGIAVPGRRPANLRRWVYGLGGLAIFMWLRVEDNHTLPAALVGWGIALVVGLDWSIQTFGLGRRSHITWTIIAGAVGLGIGIGAALASAGMMLVKNGLHGHLFPDFPFGVVAAMLSNAPAWGGAGLLAGIGMVLIRHAFRP